MDVFKLSRNWFDWCFENPEKIKPNHSALYFFCIEHCNRLGWKGKFGLPTTMAKEAIGISSYNTYKNTLDDLVEWGFIKMVQISKNQYSSNIIAISNFDKALDKALDKAMLKHGTKHSIKQDESTGSIDLPETLIPETLIPLDKVETWRENFEIYSSELNMVYENLTSDKNYIKEQEEFNTGIDIVLSLKKAVTNFWSKPAGWKHKKKTKQIENDWKATLTSSIEKNKVWKPKIKESEIRSDTVTLPNHY